MARKPRIHYPGALYHVVLRGNAKQDIFFSDTDRRRFCDMLKEGVGRFGHRVHAFSCMQNHVHLALQVAEVPLSRIVQNFGFRYAQWFNKRRRRTGHLFQGRYKAMVVDGDAYLLQLVRYIHLNPVRARMVKDVGLSRWTSHRAYLGEEDLPWVTTEWVLSQFSDNIARARREYRAFLQRGPLDARSLEIRRLRRGSTNSRILGDDTFADEVIRKAGGKVGSQIGLDGIVQTVCALYGIEQERLSAPGKDRMASEARSLVAWAVKDAPGVSLTDASRRLKRDISSLSAGSSRLLAKSKHDRATARRFRALEAALQEIPKCKA